MSVLLIENTDFKRFYPITRTKFLWNITTGIYSPLERYERQFQDVKVLSIRFSQKPFSYLSEEFSEKIYQKDSLVNTIINSQYIPSENLSPQMNTIGITKDGNFIYLREEKIKPDIIEKIINKEIKSLLSKYKVIELENGIFLKDLTDIIKYNSQAIECDSFLVKRDSNFITPDNNIYIEKTAKIQQFVSLQAENGPIIIDKSAVVRSFTIIDGPAYIGKSSLIDSAKIRSGTTIKDYCKIGGEVEESIIESYSNKHHEGFLGHSYAGNWVNIGAMATTSNLKNNYSEVKLKIGEKQKPTGCIKFGSIICDYTKIGIGIMLNTGTVICEGCNLFNEGKIYPPFVKPFSWGLNKVYEIEKFIEDMQKMMSRRNIKLNENRIKFLKAIHRSR